MNQRQEKPDMTYIRQTFVSLNAHQVARIEAAVSETVEAMTPETPITISYPGNGLDNDIETTWGAFVADNDDAEMVADVAAQIAEHNYARIGGGASPEIWVFA